MDADPGLDSQRRPELRTERNPDQPGGTIAPANRAAVAKERFQTPEVAAAERFELRDPFAEVTYRSRSFDDMVLKADQLNATRFQAVTTDGKRTPVVKVQGIWQRSDRPAMEPAIATKDSPQRADSAVPPATNPTSPESTGAQVAKLEAQAARAAYVERLKAALHERYVIKRPLMKVGDLSLRQTEYRFRGDTLRLAFTESTFKLSTDTNNPSVARSMVDVAEARNWRALRVSGNEDFKRLVWLEASVRGVKAVGYDPQQSNLELLRREREARQVNRIEPAPPEKTATAGDASTNGTGKQSARGNGGRKAVLAALEAVLVSKGVPAKQREAVMAAAADNLAQRLSKGEVHKVKVYDPAAPSQRPNFTPTPQPQRTRERAAPAR